MDHLSRLDNPHLEELLEDEINDKFPEENLYAIDAMKKQDIPWFTDIANYLVGKVLPQNFDFYKKKKFFS